MSQIQVELQESMGNDRRVAESAWTSSATHDTKLSKTDEQVASLVNRLADEHHATPFESVVFRFWIKMPIATDRQHMTHRIASHNGMSGRYRTMPSEFLDVPDDVEQILSRLNLTYVNPSNTPLDPIAEYIEMCTKANSFYQSLVYALKLEEKKNASINNAEFKRLREFFRGVLPQHNMTERVTVMNLRSFANYQRLRNSEHAQPEIREVAQLMLEAVKAANVCPVALEALERNGWQI